MNNKLIKGNEHTLLSYWRTGDKASAGERVVYEHDSQLPDIGRVTGQYEFCRNLSGDEDRYFGLLLGSTSQIDLGKGCKYQNIKR